VKTWIALLRGINVGGARALSMKELVATLTRAGFTSVRTYIQSGNVVFRADKGTAHSIGLQIARLIENTFGLQLPVLVLSVTELSDAIRANPYPRAISKPGRLQLCFLSAVPGHPDFDALEKLKTPTEAYALKGKVFYMHTPDGAGKSKLAARAERALGVHTTCRNWRTVSQLLKMSADITRLEAQ
jgi:uncharacterized protein (DUF1697 family)